MKKIGETRNNSFSLIQNNVIRYHMKTFHQQATQYYIRSSQIFHSACIRVPALFFVSRSDPIGTVSSNLTLRDNWESTGIKVRFTFAGERLIKETMYLSCRPM